MVHLLVLHVGTKDSNNSNLTPEFQGSWYINQKKKKFFKNTPPKNLSAQKQYKSSVADRIRWLDFFKSVKFRSRIIYFQVCGLVYRPERHCSSEMSVKPSHWVRGSLKYGPMHKLVQLLSVLWSLINKTGALNRLKSALLRVFRGIININVQTSLQDEAI